MWGCPCSEPLPDPFRLPSREGGGAGKGAQTPPLPPRKPSPPPDSCHPPPSPPPPPAPPPALKRSPANGPASGGGGVCMCPVPHVLPFVATDSEDVEGVSLPPGLRASAGEVPGHPKWPTYCPLGAGRPGHTGCSGVRLVLLLRGVPTLQQYRGGVGVFRQRKFRGGVSFFRLVPKFSPRKFSRNPGHFWLPALAANICLQ